MYRVVYTETFAKDIKKLDKSIVKRIINNLGLRNASKKRHSEGVKRPKNLLRMQIFSHSRDLPALPTGQAGGRQGFLASLGMTDAYFVIQGK